MRKNEQNSLGFFIYFFVSIIIITHFTNDVWDLPWYYAAIVAGILGGCAYYVWVGLHKFLNK
jgi:hypothetical protein